MIRFIKGYEVESEFTVEEMPQYGIEKVMGIDPAIPNEGELIVFRVYDDDGGLMAQGQLTDDDEAENQVAALRVGETYWGATRIKVRRNGKWDEEIA